MKLVTGLLRYPSTHPPPLQAAREKRWGQAEDIRSLPKTQGLKRQGRGPQSCNRESAIGVVVTRLIQSTKLLYAGSG